MHNCIMLTSWLCPKQTLIVVLFDCPKNEHSILGHWVASELMCRFCVTQQRISANHLQLSANAGRVDPQLHCTGGIAQFLFRRKLV